VAENPQYHYMTNDHVRTPYGDGFVQGWMVTPSGNHVLAVRIKVDNYNVQFLRQPNAIGNYKEGSDTEKRSHSAIWCFYPKSLEVIDASKPRKRAGKG